jgi:23S rRNA (guanosine2251-2'-O)-methyltransferase
MARPFDRNGKSKGGSERGGQSRPPRRRDDRGERGFEPRGERPSEPRRSGRPVIYGFHAVVEALANPARKAKVLHVTENALKRLKEMMPHLPVEPRMARPEEIDRMTGQGAVHQGIALEVDGLPAADLLDLPAKGIVLVLDQVTDPHNVGAILRSAAAFAVEGLVVTERNSPEAYGILAKTASGGLEHVPIIEVSNLAQALDKLGDMGFWRVGLDSEGESILEDSLANPPIALVFGAEGKGLRRLTRERCDVLARIDMPGAIKSLNVSNAVVLGLQTVHKAISKA